MQEGWELLELDQVTEMRNAEIKFITSILKD